jgi:hypothetical protein
MAEPSYPVPCTIDALRAVNALLEQDSNLLSAHDERLALPAYVFSQLPYATDPTLKALAKDLWRRVYAADPSTCNGRIVEQAQIWLIDVNCRYRFACRSLFSLI